MNQVYALCYPEPMTLNRAVSFCLNSKPVDSSIEIGKKRKLVMPGGKKISS